VKDLPHVTEIIRAAGMIDVKWFTDWARDRGTALHSATVLYDRGELDEGSVDPRIAGQLGAYKAWHREMAPKLIAIEELIEGDGYCGRPDRVCRIHGMTWVVDIKAGAEAASWHGVQLAAYAHALDPPHLALRRANLYLRESGRYLFRRRANPKDWPRFAAALEKWRRTSG